MSRRLAVIFPGIGYHCDKPLLYYGKKLAAQHGYEILEVPYGNFEAGIKGNPEKMEKAFRWALEQAEKILEPVNWEEREDLLFISKSVGTAVAAAYAEKKGLATRNIFFTPVEQTFLFVSRPGIVFHGNADPWAETREVERGCREKSLPLYITRGANHSMETGNVQRDLEILRQILEQCEIYISGI